MTGTDARLPAADDFFNKCFVVFSISFESNVEGSELELMAGEVAPVILVAGITGTGNAST